jgi:hypothetical protein
LLAYHATSSEVLVFGGHIADAGVQPDGVVLEPHAFELTLELAGVGDLLQVRPFAFDVAEQRLDQPLVLRDAGPAGVPGQRVHRQPLAGGARDHLRPVEFSTAVKC